jgi:hypothetical protein
MLEELSYIAHLDAYISYTITLLLYSRLRPMTACFRSVLPTWFLSELDGSDPGNKARYGVLSAACTSRHFEVAVDAVAVAVPDEVSAGALLPTRLRPSLYRGSGCGFG